MLGHATPSLPSRRPWLRFNLRTLLVGVTVLAVWFGWYANRAWRQRRAAEAIVNQGGRVFYASNGGDTNKPLPPPFLARFLGLDFVDSVTHVDFLGAEFDDADIGLLNDLPSVEWLQLYETRVTGKGFYDVPSLKTLDQLNATRTLLTDHGVAYFRGSSLRNVHINTAPISDAAFESLVLCSDLETLFIHDIPITDQGIQHLMHSKRLNNVSLRHTEITDDALKVFVNHPNLVELKLRKNAISDKGLSNLGKPPKLEHLYLDGTNVTQEGCLRFAALYDRKVRVHGPRRTAAAAAIPLLSPSPTGSP